MISVNCRSCQTQYSCLQLYVCMNLHCVEKKVYHPTFYNIFNNSCLISVIFGTVVAE